MAVTKAEDFKSKWIPLITPIANKYGINPAFALSQLAIESDWGFSTPKGSNNYGGIIETRKGVKGVTATDAGRLRQFRQFGSEAEFADHYLGLLARKYPGTVGAKTMQEFANALQDGKYKYAESPIYKQSLVQVYNKNFANGSGIVASDQSQGGNTYQGGAGLVDYANAMGDAGVKINTAVPKQPTDKDPYSDIWNVKPPAEDTSIPKGGTDINWGKSQYKTGNYKFDWGVG